MKIIFNLNCYISLGLLGINEVKIRKKELGLKKAKVLISIIVKLLTTITYIAQNQINV